MDLPQEKDVKQYQNTKLTMKLAQNPKEDSLFSLHMLFKLTSENLIYFHAR